MISLKRTFVKHNFVDKGTFLRYATKQKEVETMDERLKQLRKSLNLTQQEFADKLKIKRNTIAKYETGRGEPIDAVVSLICEKFNVSEKWLRTGEGDMFVKMSRDEELTKFFGEVSFGNSDFKRRFISVLSRLDESEWELLEKMARELAEETKKTDP